MKNFKELIVWQKAVDLTLGVYGFTKGFPQEERYGLTAQMRSAALSIPSNIAEGHMRKTAKDFKQFIAIARGSCAELETQAIVASRLGYLTKETQTIFLGKIDELSRMLSSLYAKING